MTAYGTATDGIPRRVGSPRGPGTGSRRSEDGDEAVGRASPTSASTLGVAVRAGRAGPGPRRPDAIRAPRSGDPSNRYSARSSSAAVPGHHRLAVQAHVEHDDVRLGDERAGALRASRRTCSRARSGRGTSTRRTPHPRATSRYRSRSVVVGLDDQDACPADRCHRPRPSLTARRRPRRRARGPGSAGSFAPPGADGLDPILGGMFIRYYLELAVPFDERRAGRCSPIRQVVGPRARPRDARTAAQRLLAEVGFDVDDTRVDKEVEIELGDPYGSPRRRSCRSPGARPAAERLFPPLEADIEIAAARPGRTQLSISARYRPPMGAVGRRSTGRSCTGWPRRPSRTSWTARPVGSPPPPGPPGAERPRRA